MRTVVDVHEAASQRPALLELARAGQEVILTQGGQPCARLGPVTPTSIGRRPGRLPGSVGNAFLEPLPARELDAWSPLAGQRRP